MTVILAFFDSMPTGVSVVSRHTPITPTPAGASALTHTRLIARQSAALQLHLRLQAEAHQRQQLHKQKKRVGANRTYIAPRQLPARAPLPWQRIPSRMAPPGASLPRPSPPGIGDLIVHRGTDFSAVWRDLQWDQIGRFGRPTLPAHVLPSAGRVRWLTSQLRTASCAVVGAASSLSNCSGLNSLCNYDVIIRVNDHAPVGSCMRTDIQVVNAFACVPPLQTAPPRAVDGFGSVKPAVGPRGIRGVRGRLLAAAYSAGDAATVDQSRGNASNGVADGTDSGDRVRSSTRRTARRAGQRKRAAPGIERGHATKSRRPDADVQIVSRLEDALKHHKAGHRNTSSLEGLMNSTTTSTTTSSRMGFDEGTLIRKGQVVPRPPATVQVHPSPPTKPSLATLNGTTTRSWAPSPLDSSPPPPPSRLHPAPPPPPSRLYPDTRDGVQTLRNLAGGTSEWRSCLTQPLLFRLRTEWNPTPSALKRFTSANTWLSSGLSNRHANGAVARLSTHRSGKSTAATTGGVAVAFALRSCASVALFGLGGGSSGYAGGVGGDEVDNSQDIAGVHNTDGERAWLDHLVASGRAEPVCYAPMSSAAARTLAVVRDRKRKVAAARASIDHEASAMAHLMKEYERTKQAKRVAEKHEQEMNQLLAKAEAEEQASHKERLKAIDEAAKWEREVETQKAADEERMLQIEGKKNASHMRDTERLLLAARPRNASFGSNGDVSDWERKEPAHVGRAEAAESNEEAAEGMAEGIRKARQDRRGKKAAKNKPHS